MNVIVPRMIELQRHWEDYRLKSYKDTDGSWHIGFGHGNAFGLPPFVDESTTLKDVDEAVAIHERDLEGHFKPELVKALEHDSIVLNDNQFSALLDISYNRGIGRLRGSYCWHWLKQNDMKQAAQAIVFSHVDGFTPLDVAKDRATGIERVYLGLTLRRIDDASLFQARS